MKLLNGNNIDLLKTLENNSVDSIVTDPPYGLSFMNKKWDHDVPSVEFWKECLRVLKPGGHVLSFGGTRTYHRMVVAIEDAGFEIRDQIMWLYGSGFPKSYNVSKGIDKKFGAEREVVGISENTRDRSKHQVNAMNKIPNKPIEITNAATELAKQWDGFGTALKPANEPIVVARKPLSEKNIVENVLRWGTGALNIDGCRVGTETMTSGGSIPDIRANNYENSHGKPRLKTPSVEHQGRFPANIILDEEAAEMLNKQANNVSRFFYCAKASKRERNAGLEGMPKKEKHSDYDGFTNHPRPSKETHAENFHPAVKPVKLMEYLVKLVTPPQGTVLDPFMGSGSTGVAAKKEGFNFVGMELDAEYFEIALKRINGSN